MRYVYTSGYVRQGVDAEGDVVSAWLFDPDGTVLEGPNGPVSHLICGGVYDWSTGLIYRGGRYFDAYRSTSSGTADNSFTASTGARSSKSNVAV